MDQIFNARVRDLRLIMKKIKIDYFLVPMSDENQTEYAPQDARRIEWITGFSGSTGFAIIHREKAALFVDGRYTLQAKNEVDSSLFEHHDLYGNPPLKWLADHLKKGEIIGLDPWLVTQSQYEDFLNISHKSETSLLECASNPIDQIWTDQPPKKSAPIVPHPEKFSGQSAQSKRQLIATTLKEKKVQATFISLLDSIAWIFNIRGGDIPHHPMVRAFALINDQGKADFFVDLAKLSSEVTDFLGPDISCHSLDDIEKIIKQKTYQTIGLDASSLPRKIWQFFENEKTKIMALSDLCQLPKAKKNDIECKGAQQAHIRDGAALCQYIAWLTRTIPYKEISECEGADQLESFRRKGDLFKDLSFNTISAVDANAAIVHYAPQRGKDKKITSKSTYLVDSGGHYLDGTTDVTRTLCFGSPSSEQKDRYTRVLKGHIAIANIVFPKGTHGKDLDCLARQYLWQIGTDYKHGTGHGVGSYLCVHEGPQGLGRHIPLEKGMIISNEPGFYKEGEYGIRIENLVLVVDSGNEGYLKLETLTLAPYEQKLMDFTLLTSEEISWINDYHQTVWEKISPLIDVDTRTWLEQATLAIEI